MAPHWKTSKKSRKSVALFPAMLKRRGAAPLVKKFPYGGAATPPPSPTLRRSHAARKICPSFRPSVQAPGEPRGSLFSFWEEHLINDPRPRSNGACWRLFALYILNVSLSIFGRCRGEVLFPTILKHKGASSEKSSPTVVPDEMCN